MKKNYLSRAIKAMMISRQRSANMQVARWLAASELRNESPSYILTLIEEDRLHEVLPQTR